MPNFVIRSFKNYPELVPLASFISFALLIGAGSILYGLYIKPDVIVNKKRELQPWELLKGDQDIKLVNLNQQYKVIPELEDLKREIGSFKY